MEKEELLEKIQELKQSASSLSEPEKTFKLSDVSQLEKAIQGMALSEIAEKMNSFSLDDLESMNIRIQEAKDATNDYSQRVNAFNTAYNFLKNALGILI